MTETNVEINSPVLCRVWKEGKRIEEEHVIAAECDGETVELITEDGETVFEEGEWDELTVQHD